MIPEEKQDSGACGGLPPLPVLWKCAIPVCFGRPARKQIADMCYEEQPGS